MKYLKLAFTFLLFTGLMACSGSKKTSSTEEGRIKIPEQQTEDTGYGSVEASRKTTAGTSQKVNQDSNIPLETYLRKVPGLQISGSGDNTSIKVRGVNSIISDNGPLFILDGAPIGNNFSSVNASVDVNDIHKVTVLRDQASLAIYGSRGANGVILIKTKR